MFLNASLFNSEARHGVTDCDIERIEKLDEALLRGILNAHAKVPIEALYLETGAIPVRYILKSRRINFLQNILKKHDEELVREVLNAQKESPLDGDFCKLVVSDPAQVNLSMTENEMTNSSNAAFKTTVKNKVKTTTFKALIEA